MGKFILFLVLFYLVFGLIFNFGITLLIDCTEEGVQNGTCDPSPIKPLFGFGFVGSLLISIIISYLLSCAFVHTYKIAFNKK